MCPPPLTSLEVSPGPSDNTVRDDAGRVLTVPDGWVLLAPGDPGLTRRVKKAGPSWTVREKRGRKKFSRGVWAPRDRIDRIRAELETERADPRYTRKLEASRVRRAREEDEYQSNFLLEVRAFLAFDPSYEEREAAVALAITEHATPVGSNTVARTKRISIERRAEAATIAWLRHQTTGYDDMQIPRVKGMRREVRRMLAHRSRELLGRYRRGDAIDEDLCPLARAIGAEADLL